MNAPLPISVYCTPEWWDRYFHDAVPRPERPSPEALDRLFRQRQAFVRARFGDEDLASETGPGQIATVILYGFDLIPALLGTPLDYADAWGFYPRTRPLTALAALEAVNLAATREGDWLLREKERLVRAYGSCTHCLDLGSATNNAFRLLGEDLYAELLAEPDAVHRLFDVILTTMEHACRFIKTHFGGLDPVPISNCNVSLMGPHTYRRLVLEYDARQNRFGQTEKTPPRAALHHCDVPADAFLEAYAQLPGLASLQASIRTDLAAFKRTLPGCAFSGMVSPHDLVGAPQQVEPLLRRALAEGVADLALWNIDTATPPEQLRSFLSALRALARDHGRAPSVTFMPLCWEEIEWAHARYQGAGPVRSPPR